MDSEQVDSIEDSGVDQDQEAMQDGDHLLEAKLLEDGGLELTDNDEAGAAGDDPGSFSNGEEEGSLLERLSGFLFVSPRPLSVEKLIELCSSNESEVQNALDRMQFELRSSGFGVELLEVNGSFQLRTIPRIKKSLQALITPKMKRLSKAAAESLAVIAYKQPVPRAEIEAIRGVDALPTLKTLLDARLIRIVGREDTPGSPALYGTTEFFLERFGLRGLSELPTVREIAQLEEETADSKQLELFADQVADHDGQDAEDGEFDQQSSETLIDQLEVSDSLPDIEIDNSPISESDNTRAA